MSDRHGGDVGALAAAVCAVMADVPAVAETGVNAFHKYRYASDEDLLRALQPAMARHGLALMPVSTTPTWTVAGRTKAGAEQIRTDVVVTYRLLHRDGGWLDLQSVGSGIDGEDKGAYKALTGAYKYVLRQTFAVPTGEDAEKHAPEPTRRRDSERHSAAPSARDNARTSSDAPTPAPTPTDAATTKGEHHPSWSADRAGFSGAMSKAFPELKNAPLAVAAWCESTGRPRPSAMDAATRGKLRAYIGTDAGQQKFWAWHLDHEAEWPLKAAAAPSDELPPDGGLF